ncbi:unnamed protein product [Hermetia illucens]|uniref:Galectin n=1 Tax=Hermetia illucens TaxID=343691 RepID=A0A7R8YV56_HERIL|nr:uncharacterized protein LOC119652361 isoform X2 [Hermetia illucens]CAD7085426.1 unnamed protein product [Hermetia illucens]
MNIWKGKVLSEVPFGHVLIVKGKIKPNPNKICLDLAETSTEKDSSGVVLLKIEANFRENQIIRSMYHPGKGWSQEEISKNWKKETPKNPLVPGQSFIFRIAVLQKCFEIYVNDQLYGTFEHLECPNKIKYVIATGDFEKITQFHHRCLFPLIFPKSDLMQKEKEVFQSDVPKKYEMGTIVVLEGICRGPQNSEFSINFLCNETSKIFLKFLVQFERKTVIRTSQREQYKFNVEDEETCGEFPFKRGKAFRIAFGWGEKAVMIAVNGRFFTYFNFPFTPFAISTIKCCTNEVADFAVNGLEYHSDTSLLTRVEQLSMF